MKHCTPPPIAAVWLHERIFRVVKDGGSPAQVVKLNIELLEAYLPRLAPPAASRAVHTIEHLRNRYPATEN